MKIIFEGNDMVKKNFILDELINDENIWVSGFLVDREQNSKYYKSYYIRGLGDSFYDVSKKEELMVGKVDCKGNIICNPEAFDLFGVNSLLHNIKGKNILIMECINSLGKDANVFKEVARDILNSNKSVVFLTDIVDESIVNTMNLRNDIHYLNFDQEDYSLLKNYIDRAKEEIR